MLYSRGSGILIAAPDFQYRFGNGIIPSVQPESKLRCVSPRRAASEIIFLACEIALVKGFEFDWHFAAERLEDACGVVKYLDVFKHRLAVEHIDRRNNGAFHRRNSPCIWRSLHSLTTRANTARRYLKLSSQHYLNH